MKNVIKFLSTALVLLLFTSTAQAQTIAFVVSEDIVQQMPTYKKAKAELEAYSKQLQAMLEQKRSEMERYYNDVSVRSQNGTLTPRQQQEAETKLQQMQASLQEEAAKADQKLAQKEQEITKPLYQQLDAALKKVAQKNKYTYIFDKKILLYSEGGIDATAKVKAELGIIP